MPKENIYNDLYERANRGEIFVNLMPLVLSRENIIPKPNGSTRPLGIPCIWDRLIQQCFKQVLKCSVENAIADTCYRLQKSHLHYVIEFDIKSFFDNVNHAKLIRQMWTLGIRDKHLLGKILRMLKAPIKMPNVNRAVMTVITNRLKGISRKGSKLTRNKGDMANRLCSAQYR